MDFSADVLKNNLTNPQRTYLWEILIPSPVGGGDSQMFTVRAQSTEIPSISVGKILIPYKQTPGIVVAGKQEVDHTWEITIVEGEDHAVYDALYAWLSKIVDPITGVGVGDPLYRTDLILILQNTTGGDNLKIKIKSAYVQSISKAALSYESDGYLKYTVTFAFNNIEKG